MTSRRQLFTRNTGTDWSPGWMRTSPCRSVRTRPCLAARAICGSVRVGNINARCSGATVSDTRVDSDIRSVYARCGHLHPPRKGGSAPVRAVSRALFEEAPLRGVSGESRGGCEVTARGLEISAPLLEFAAGGRIKGIARKAFRAVDGVDCVESAFG